MKVVRLRSCAPKEERFERLPAGDFRAVVSKDVTYYFSCVDLLDPDVPTDLVAWLRAGNKPHRALGVRAFNGIALFEGDVLEGRLGRCVCVYHPASASFLFKMVASHRGCEGKHFSVADQVTLAPDIAEAEACGHSLFLSTHHKIGDVHSNPELVEGF